MNGVMLTRSALIRVLIRLKSEELEALRRELASAERAERAEQAEQEQTSTSVRTVLDHAIESRGLGHV
jgi:hypothetical protein